MPGIGLGTSPVFVRAVPFTPAALFAAGEVGFWGEVKLDTVWQDSARTTPGAVGQPVGSWMLNTASGVIYATASGTARPTLGQDGALFYLEFDGSSDLLQTGAINFSASAAISIHAGFQKASDAARATLVELGNATTGGVRIEAPNANANPAIQFLSLGGTSRSVTVTRAAPYLGVITALSQISTDTCIMRLNGTQVASETGDQGSASYANQPVNIGARSNPTQWLNGRVYCMVMRGALTGGASLTLIENWCNARTGAY
jgi:hypothetical protein